MYKTALISALTLMMSLGLQAKELYDYEVNFSKPSSFSLSKLKGRTVLFVNIATRCGYTGQLEDLEKLNKKYSKKGLTIVGIPANDFGSQTPEDDKGVAEFCKLNYGVTFPLTKKMVVTGKEKAPVIDYILNKSGGSEIGWNFEKFLFSKEGKLIKRFKSSDTPLEGDIEKLIVKNL